MSPVGAIFVPFPPKTGTNMLHPRPPPIVELVSLGIVMRGRFAMYSNLASLVVGRLPPSSPRTSNLLVMGSPVASIVFVHQSEHPYCCDIYSFNVYFHPTPLVKRSTNPQTLAELFSHFLLQIYRIGSAAKEATAWAIRSPDELTLELQLACVHPRVCVLAASAGIGVPDPEDSSSILNHRMDRLCVMIQNIILFSLIVPVCPYRFILACRCWYVLSRCPREGTWGIFDVLGETVHRCRALAAHAVFSNALGFKLATLCARTVILASETKKTTSPLPRLVVKRTRSKVGKVFCVVLLSGRWRVNHTAAQGFARRRSAGRDGG